jgi:hypothetical protein
MKFETALSIYRQLRNFGLDWTEWFISDVHENAVVVLKHRDDPDFSLEGLLSSRPNGHAFLQSLTVASL